MVMHGLDLITTSVLGALGCDMTVFLRYFPAAEIMYHVFVALSIGLILLNLVWQLFKNFGLGTGIEAEDPVKLTIRSVLFILLAYFSDNIVNTVLEIGGTPYRWIMDSELPTLALLILISHAGYYRRLRQRGGCSHNSGSCPDTGVELFKAALRGCGALYPAGSACLYRSCSLLHGSRTGYIKHF